MTQAIESAAPIAGLNPNSVEEKALLRQFSSLAIGLLVLTFMAVGSEPILANSDRPPLTLIGVHQDVVANSYDHAQAAITAARDVLGAQVSRSTLRWDIVEPSRKDFDWSHVDFVVGRLKAAGIQPLFTLVGSPTWANGVDPSVPRHAFYVPADQASFDRWVADFASFAHEAARRYRADVRLWEVWNEPNEHFFWLPEPNVARYAKVYDAIRDAIRSENPEAQVAVGGVAGVAAGCCISGLEFTQGLITAGVPMDAVALHPYPSNGHAPDVHVEWQDNFDDIGTVRELLESTGQSQVQIWVTEWGWSSSVGEDIQAAYVRRSLEMLRSQYPYVAVATLFLDADRPGEYDYGLLRANFTPKPAGTEFAAFMQERAAPSPPTDAPEPPRDGSVQGGAQPSAPTASPASPDTPAPTTSGEGGPQPSTPAASPASPDIPAPAASSEGSTPRGTESPASTPSSSPPPVPALSRRPVQLTAGAVELTPRPAKVGGRFAVRMRVSWRPVVKPRPRRAIAATLSVGGARMRLVKSGWDGSTAYAEWRLPPRARGKKIVGSILVRYGDSVVRKRFATSVR